MTLIKCIFSFFFIVNISAVKCTGTLVLVESLTFRETHHSFFEILVKQGLNLTFKLADDPNLTLTKYGEYLFQNLIIFAPSITEFGGSVTVQTLTNFVDSGGNVMVGLNSHHADGMREFANECGFDIDEEGSYVIDHLNYDVKDSGNHTLLVIDSRSIVNAPTVVGSKHVSPILFQGVGITSDQESPLIMEIFSSAATAYSQNPAHKIVDYPHAVGKNILLVAALQARNNARVVFSGSIDLFSDVFFQMEVQKAHGGKTAVASGNRELVNNLSQWVFKSTGVLRIQNVTHHRKNEKSPSTAYTVKDIIVYSIEVAILRNEKWSVYEADDIQLELVRIDPFVRTFLKRQGDKYVAEVKLPDICGIYQFKVDYRRIGYTHLFTTTQITVRPPEHTQYERFIPVAYPYYLSAFSMMFGVFIFSIAFLYVDESRKKKD